MKTSKVARTRLPDLEGPQTGASPGLPQVLGTHTMTPYESRAKMDPSTLRIIHSDFSHFFFFLSKESFTVQKKKELLFS